MLQTAVVILDISLGIFSEPGIGPGDTPTTTMLPQELTARGVHTRELEGRSPATCLLRTQEDKDKDPLAPTPQRLGGSQTSPDHSTAPLLPHSVTVIGHTGLFEFIF